MLVKRYPLISLAIPFGTAGLCAMWTALCADFGLPIWAPLPIWIIAAVAWIWAIVAHIVRGTKSPDSLASQLRSPTEGPTAGLVPVVGMLLGTELYHFAPIPGLILILASIAAATLFVSWLIAFWMRAGIQLDSVHGGFLLPTGAAGFVAATAAATAGMTDLAIACLAVGLLWWVIITAILTGRLMSNSNLPAPLVPSLAVTLAPPVVAGGAWFAIAGPVADPIQLAFAGFTVVALLTQLALIPVYRKTPFTLGFWSFTFPLAALGRYSISWLSLLHPVGWQVYSIAIAVVMSAVIVAIAVASVRLYFRSRHAITRTPQTAG